MRKKNMESHPKSDVQMKEKFRVLLAEDDNEMCRLIASVLRKDGYHVTQCSNGINLLSHLTSYVNETNEEHYDVIISDIRMPGLTGMEVVEGLHRIPKAPPMILITAFGDAETHAAALRQGAVALLDKPFDMESLLDQVRSLLPGQPAASTGS
ncbi:MAG: response regulator [Candidatus Eisenbacteria bacterium]|uniref:Response regulator n=1 Tax=Eiseniibacteriota bacterium TaxID=2212470 RepID=A0A948RW39_UNCEI|nr:response regulator [Candidatus Eisenbacteria bacterium]MBU1949544.1 response regulator [Candidatus Eisenbacteria bacterium]MBU2691935.1 response regulator [Candidatus Eisenbacteria bacterium]